MTITRSGGFAGLRREREVDLDDGTDRAARLAALVASGRLRTDGQPRPDRFVYRLVADDLDLTVHESDLDPDDRALLDDCLR